MSTMDSIVQASMHDSSTQWTELLIRLKQSLLVAFDSKINETEDSLRTMISTRSRNDWNFQEFFILKVDSAIRPWLSIYAYRPKLNIISFICRLS